MLDRILLARRGVDRAYLDRLRGRRRLEVVL
jgi:hypothetical protein